MLRIKKLDIFVLKSFLLLFAGTFFICLFIFMMQFLWRYVDELVGKGLEIKVLAQFFFLSALTLIPLSLPLAILLAALMTFGNFGERYELLSMKAAGIPLLRIMQPVILFCVLLGLTSFFFQNVVGPKAQKELWTLIVSMKQKSPEVDIPEGVFYSDIDGYNIYVKQKDRETGILKDVLIYNFSDGFENAHIIWAAEGKLCGHSGLPWHTAGSFFPRRLPEKRYALSLPETEALFRSASAFSAWLQLPLRSVPG